MTKPHISRMNQKARLTFAEEHDVWRDENWSKVYFSEANKFNLFGSNGKHYVHHQTGERLNSKCVNKSVNGGGGSVMGSLIQIHGR